MLIRVRSDKQRPTRLVWPSVTCTVVAGLWESNLNLLASVTSLT
jgi:hypothetical protein